jgi:hypothetical protein
LDNAPGADATLWDVRVELGSRDIDVERFHSAVKADLTASKVQAPAPGYPQASAAFLIQACDETQARGLVEEVVKRALEASLRAPVDVSYGVEVYPYRPGTAVRGPGVTF